MKMLGKIIKFLLPYGIVEVNRRLEELRRIGVTIKPWQWHKSGRFLQSSISSGLYMLPTRLAPELKYIVDVGANVGSWTLMALDCTKPLKVMAFEPEPENFAKLQLNTKKFTNVEIHNVVVGDRKGTIRLNITRDATAASVLEPEAKMKDYIEDNWRVNDKKDCPMDTLDNLVAGLPEISFLKIDVQGFEKQVLAGAANTLEKTKFLLIELNYFSQYVGGSEFNEVHDILTKKHNFQLCNLAPPLLINRRAIMSDGLYVNPRLVRL
ncbi:MAG: FkbM family methyltransferase [Candidatus Omnitrophica bacterium]|nr:FkbM family methyltransferase [Candidatus Omnitrophota bacterium]